MIPRYRPTIGIALWVVASLVDLALVTVGPAWWRPPDGPAGFLSLAGFLLAVGWSMAWVGQERRG